MKKQQVEIPSLLKRVNYFYGQLLTQADLTAEQSYIIKRSRLHNLHVHGDGVVSGLNVSVSKESAETLMVSPGVAIDPLGNEIIVPSAVKIPYPKKGDTAHLMLYWAERETDFVPVSEGNMPSRVEEYAFLNFKVEYPSTKPKTRKIFESHDGIILARLKTIRNTWKVDKKFRVRRVKKT